MENRPSLTPSGEYFLATYRLGSPDPTNPISEAEALAVAGEICVEQTVEYPRDLITSRQILDEIIGQVVELSPWPTEVIPKEDQREDPARRILASGTEVGLQDVGPNLASGRKREGPGAAAWRVVIRYAAETAGRDLVQLLNVLFGNTSLKPCIRLDRIEISPELLNTFAGPRFGCGGLRRLSGIARRPLLCTAVKPMGLSPTELADLAYRLALGGIDLIKDDHGLADQPFSPFKERLWRCAQAVERANRETGHRCLYLPSISGPADQVSLRAAEARSSGAGGLLLAPGLVGFDTLRAIAADDRIGLPILSHPALLGSYVVEPEHGISPFALFGQLMRLAGADGCIFPHPGGRFSFTLEQCRQIAEGCRCKMGSIEPIFPVPAGGMNLDRVGEMCDFYGKEVILLIGGDLHRRGPDLVQSCRKFVELVEDWTAES
ncbi:MAG: hypothetical protein JW797_13050 [Bradymonadales bacterium]|nr:hypothetical protein [Bradymonadales bacterium]